MLKKDEPEHFLFNDKNNFFQTVLENQPKKILIQNAYLKQFLGVWTMAPQDWIIQMSWNRWSFVNAIPYR